MKFAAQISIASLTAAFASSGKFVKFTRHSDFGVPTIAFLACGELEPVEGDAKVYPQNRAGAELKDNAGAEAGTMREINRVVAVTTTVTSRRFRMGTDASGLRR